MQVKLLVLGALPAALAGVPHPSGSGHSKHTTTKTVYSTSIATVTSCAPTKTDCPAHVSKGAVVYVTKVVPVSTTVCVEDDDEPETTSWVKDWGCSTTTKYKEHVYTSTSTKAPFVVTTQIPVTTITKKYYETEYQTIVSTYTTKVDHYKYSTVTTTTVKPTNTVVKYSTSTSFSDCVHTVTNATVVYPYTKTVPDATYTYCPAKPTTLPGKPDWDHDHPDYSKPVGQPTYDNTWAPKPTAEHTWAPKPTGEWPKGAAAPTGGSATTSSSKTVVTAGAAKDFGASGAIKMLGAAAAAAVLVL